MNSPLSQGRWIAAPIVGGPCTMAPAPYLRKSFQLAQPVRSAVLTVTALGLYECEINGQRIGDEVFAPGWTDYSKRVQYQTYDVAGLLGRGENVLGAICADGWYCGYVGWKQRRQRYGDRPRLRAQLDIVLEDGTPMTLGTDGTWKAIAGPILEADILMGESYDARLELGGWSSPGYDDAAWQPVQISTPEREPALSPRVGPPVRRIQELETVSAKLLPGWQKEDRLIDLGQNFSGRVRIRVTAPRGTVVKLRHGEMLNPDGSLYTENLRTARATDYYTCKGEPGETWEPRFTFHGFRYVEAGGLAKDDALSMTGIVLHTDLKPTGRFACSNPLLNQLQHNITWGQKSNFLEVPTDCPQRDERLGWTGDAQAFIRTASFNMDMREFFHKWMRDVAEAQREPGGIPSVVPNPDIVDWEDDGGPAWADAAIICPWTIYLCYADRTILQENYPVMRRYMDFLAKHKCKGHIRAHPDVDKWGGYGDWLALDGSGILEGLTSRDLIGTAFYAYDATILAEVACILGLESEAAEWRRLRGEIVEAFQRRFVTPEGLVMPGTQTAYVLALHFDLLPSEIRSTAAAELARLIEKRDWHLATGFVGTPYLLETLENAGRLDIAYRLLEQETFPSWLFPVKNGATTIWERWDGWTPEKGFQDKGMNSFNHYAYGAVGDWMYRSVAGIELDPREPGYRHIIFRPRPGGTLTWAEARLDTAQGTAAIRWDLDGASLRLKFTVPAGSRATLSSPEGYEADRVAFEPGDYEIALASSR